MAVMAQSPKGQLEFTMLIEMPDRSVKLIRIWALTQESAIRKAKRRYRGVRIHAGYYARM